ncbi:hypothetical protein SH661x_000398 [Planctomicrobium sp. SH661]|uniref:hypothetical protein n=1 Tax=Planctomicrobium sp. SH661 TaxID=3448124 RepID=UPI003F5C98A8
MISQKTAEEIWHCYREIGAGEKLLEDLDQQKKDHPDDRHAQNLKDAFGRRRQLQLGIPSGSNSHSLYDVSQTLAESIIRAHIANKKAELAQYSEKARIELSDLPDK